MYVKEIYGVEESCRLSYRACKSFIMLVYVITAQRACTFHSVSVTDGGCMDFYPWIPISESIYLTPIVENVLEGSYPLDLGQIRPRDTLCEVLLYIYCVDNNHQLNTVFTLCMPLLSNLFERM
jgi:hypothetical protein